ncbi:DUF6519 domain-containing protein [Bacterioplanoides sp.]|uniref:DUF6519 domain-containing protein n=1 Tax=Bacterioplanoides sp. TaxID=2066072 RepID=UPI003AFF8372
MKTEVSRFSHQPDQAYSGVYQQQGRMITDADWNELVDILKSRLQKATSAAMGATTIPAAGGLLQHRLSETELNQAPATGPDKTPFFEQGQWQLQWGTACVDGIYAELRPVDVSAGDGVVEEGIENTPFAIDQQADLPLPAGTEVVPGTYHLYLDVWERSVTSVEDPQLLDIALRGADTCSRSQVMCQLKWCPLSIDPADGDQNPVAGNARIDIQVRDETIQSLDPCVAQVGKSTNVGNFLFRVEVHQVHYNASGMPVQVVLKWSRENGAEQYHFDYQPPGFVSSSGLNDWVYEGFTDQSEQLLGRHLQSGIEAPVFALRSDVNFPGDKPTYVRRWDGFAQLDFVDDGWALAAGRDRQQTLAMDIGPGNHGHTTLTEQPDGSVWLTSHLELFNLSLQLNVNDAGPNQFVPGDYWLAVVREVDDDDDPETLNAEVTLMNQGLPVGIQHHYLTLGQAQLTMVDGQLQLNPDSLQLLPAIADYAPMYSAPSLSELDATHIRYNPNRVADRWQDVLESESATLPTNLQDAMDWLLQELESSDIRFDFDELPCEQTSYGVPSYKARLKQTLVALLNDDQSLPLNVLLSALLCNTDAGLLPYDDSLQRDDWQGVVTGFEGGDAATIQQAIDLLIQHLHQLWDQGRGSGCAVTVGEGGAFDNIQQALQTLAGQSSIILCLLPGSYRIDNELTVRAMDTIKITGAGTQASTVTLHAPLQLDGLECILRDVHFRASERDPQAFLGLRANQVDIKHCLIDQALQRQPQQPLLAIETVRSWWRLLGSHKTAAVTPHAVIVDSQMQRIVTGHFSGRVMFGADSIRASADNGSAFVAKYSADGKPLWIRVLEQGVRSAGLTLTLLKDDSVFVGGHIIGDAKFDGQEVSGSMGSADIFVARVSAAGEVIWVSTLGSRGSDNIYDALVNQDGHIVMTGSFQGELQFKDETLLDTVGGTDNFIISMDVDGGVQQAKAFGGAGTDRVFAMATDEKGDLYLTGEFEKEMRYQGAELSQTSGEFRQLFLLKLTPDAELIWLQNFKESKGNNGGRSLKVFKDQIVLGGYFSGSLTIGELAPMVIHQASDTAEIDSRKARIAALRARVQELNADIAGTDQDITDLNLQITAIDQRLSTLEASLATSRIDHTGVATQLQDLDSHIVTLENNIANQNSAISRMELELAGINDLAIAKENEIRQRATTERAQREQLAAQDERRISQILETQISQEIANRIGSRPTGVGRIDSPIDDIGRDIGRDIGIGIPIDRVGDGLQLDLTTWNRQASLIETELRNNAESARLVREQARSNSETVIARAIEAEIERERSQIQQAAGPIGQQLQQARGGLVQLQATLTQENSQRQALNEALSRLLAEQHGFATNITQEQQNRQNLLNQLAIKNAERQTLRTQMAQALAEINTLEVANAQQLNKTTNGSDRFICVLQADDGKPLWQQHISAEGQERGPDLALDRTGKILVSGCAAGDVFVASTQIKAQTSAAGEAKPVESYYLEFSPEGELLKHKQLYGKGDVVATAITSAPDGSYSLTGTMQRELWQHWNKESRHYGSGSGGFTLTFRDDSPEARVIIADSQLLSPDFKTHTGMTTEVDAETDTETDGDKYSAASPALWIADTDIDLTLSNNNIYGLCWLGRGMADSITDKEQAQILVETLNNSCSHLMTTITDNSLYQVQMLSPYAEGKTLLPQIYNNLTVRGNNFIGGDSVLMANQSNLIQNFFCRSPSSRSLQLFVNSCFISANLGPEKQAIEYFDRSPVANNTVGNQLQVLNWPPV